MWETREGLVTVRSAAPIARLEWLADEGCSGADILYSEPTAMAQPPPLLLKHPVAPSPTPNVAQTTNGAATGAQFIPRREFIRDHRIASSFSLLALSGSGFVRLYSFSATVIAALRRLFDHRKLVSSVREHAPKQFYEFSLEGKPWSNAKSITAEKLIIDILTIILHCGYIFLSTIDYGREPDDKLAIVFSKPQMAQNPLFPLSNGSAVSLNPPVIKTPFAISFSSATQLRVVGPPLHSTPAVLQAVRGAWPRGVVSEKKVGDATYEFKLKGYKCEHCQHCLEPRSLLNSCCRVPGGYICYGFAAPHSRAAQCARYPWLHSPYIPIPLQSFAHEGPMDIYRRPPRLSTVNPHRVQYRPPAGDYTAAVQRCSRPISALPGCREAHVPTEERARDGNCRV